MAIDSSQLAQQVAWLDEQHRRDRGELVALQQRMEAQSAQLLEISRKQQESEGRLASVTAQLTRFAQVDQALAQLKEEVTIMLRREEEQRQLAEREASRIRLLERETQTKAINDLRQQVRTVSKLQDELELRKAEDQRLSEAIMALRQNLIDSLRPTEGWSKSLTYLEEQRRQDAKRFAQLQQESAELLKRTEGLRGQFDVMEKSTSRLETRLNSLWNMRDELKSEVLRIQENVLLGEEERERRVNSFAAQFQIFTQEMAEYNEQFQAFREAFNANQRTVATLSQLEERLKRDQAQVSELQRLAEERMRKEFEEFQAEDERRWRKHEVSSDQRWSEQNRTNTGLTERFPPLEEQVKSFIVQFNELWELQQSLVRLRSAEMERLLGEFSKFWDNRTR